MGMDAGLGDHPSMAVFSLSEKERGQLTAPRIKPGIHNHIQATRTLPFTLDFIQGFDNP